MTSCDIVLVRPWNENIVSLKANVQDPLGIGYLSAVLRRAGNSVFVLDASVFGFTDSKVVECIQKLNPKMVGLSLHSFLDYRHVASITEGICLLKKDIAVIWGGEQATFQAEKILMRHKNVHAVVLGEGEVTVVELLRNVIVGENHKPVKGAMINGLSGEIIFGGHRLAIENLDSLPEPHKDIAEASLLTGRRFSFSILTGRGCTNSCDFCTAHTFLRIGGGKVWRRRSHLSVVNEMENLVKYYMWRPNVNPVLQFQDVIFLGTSKAAKTWTISFLSEMERRGLSVPFYCMARADSIIANRDLLPMLVKAGLCSVEVGIESGIDRLLGLYHKNNSVKDNEFAISLLQKHGIAFDASGFIMFDPRMTRDELKVNANFLAEFGAATWDFYVSRLQLYPGTAVKDEMIKNGLFPPDADIDNTSGYSFKDLMVGEVAKHTWYYDPVIRSLDSVLRTAKAVVAYNVRSNDSKRNDNNLKMLIKDIQLFYRDFLIDLLELAENREIKTKFPDRMYSFVEKSKEHLLRVESSLTSISSASLSLK